MELQPIKYKEACDYIKKHNSQYVPSQGWTFGIAVNDGEKIVGVIAVGKPAAQYKNDGLTLEVTHCCTDGTKGVNSMLYASALRATTAMGYKQLITYTIISKSGEAEKNGLLQAASERISSQEKATLNSIIMFPKEKKEVFSDVDILHLQLIEAKRLFEKLGYDDWKADVSDCLERLDRKDFSFLEKLWLKFAPTCDIDDLIIIAPHLHQPPLTQEQANKLNDELSKVANGTFAAINKVQDSKKYKTVGIV